MLYRSTDRLCRRGAPMKNLAHSASFESLDKDAPSKPGTKQVSHLERWAVFGPRATVVVNPRRGDVGVPKPILHLGDIGLVIEGVGGGRRPQRMRPDLETESGRVRTHKFIDAVRRDRLVELAGRVVPDRPE